MNDLNYELDDTIADSADLQEFSTTLETDMNDFLDSFNFNPDEIQMPWDAEGNITALDSVVGTPTADAQFWQPQTTGFTCAVVAQRGIIEAFTGEPVSEAQLVYDATINGWLTDRGMSPMDAGNLLKLYGIDCHVTHEAAVEDLIAELSQGHKVIVGVDSGELWKEDFPLEDFFHQAADHAIWITGVDFSDPANPKAIINDSGDPNGCGKEYDLSDFVDAWQDSGFFYVATDNAPPDFHMAASAFNVETGVFPELVSYFSSIDAGFHDRLQGEGHEAFLDLTKNSIASLDEASVDQVFRMI